MTVAHTGTKICSVQMAERYIALGSVDGSSDLHGITRSKNGVKLGKQGGLSYTRMQELLLEKSENWIGSKAVWSPQPQEQVWVLA